MMLEALGGPFDLAHLFFGEFFSLRRLPNDVGGDDDDRFRGSDGLHGIGEQSSEQRDVSQDRNAQSVHGASALDQPADENRLPVLAQQLGGDFGARLRGN